MRDYGYCSGSSHQSNSTPARNSLAPARVACNGRSLVCSVIRTLIEHRIRHRIAGCGLTLRKQSNMKAVARSAILPEFLAAARAHLRPYLAYQRVEQAAFELAA